MQNKYLYMYLMKFHAQYARIQDGNYEIYKRIYIIIIIIIIITYSEPNFNANTLFIDLHYLHYLLFKFHYHL